MSIDYIGHDIFNKALNSPSGVQLVQPKKHAETYVTQASGLRHENLSSAAQPSRLAAQRPGNVKKLACSICHKSFSRRDILLRHTYLHNPDRALGSQASSPVSEAPLRQGNEGYNDTYIPRAGKVNRASPQQSPVATKSPLSASAGISKHQLAGVKKQKSNKYPGFQPSKPTSTRLDHGTIEDEFRQPPTAARDELVNTPSMLSNITLHLEEFTRPQPVQNQLSSSAQGTRSESPVPASPLHGLRHLSTPSETLLPKSNSIVVQYPMAEQALVHAYVTYFVPNLPFLHLPSLDIDAACEGRFMTAETASSQGPSRRLMCKALYLSVITMGAAHLSQPVLARELYNKTTLAMMEGLKEANRTGSLPLRQQLIQTLVHQVISGPQLYERSLDEAAIGHRCSLLALAKEADIYKSTPGVFERHASTQSWGRWAGQEEQKRLCFAISCVMSIGATYTNNMPIFSMDEWDLELPCDESLWEAKDAETWRGLVKELRPVCLSFKLAMNRLLLDGENSHKARDLTHLSASTSDKETGLTKHTRNGIGEFGCHVLISALNLRALSLHRKADDGPEHDIGGQRQSILRATERWHVAWLDFPKSPAFSSSHRLLTTSLAVLSLVRTSFLLDMTGVKDAIFERDDQAIHRYFESCFNSALSPFVEQRPLGDATNIGHGQSEQNSYGHNEQPWSWSQVHETAFNVAKFLETIFNLGPWWHENSAARHLPASEAMAAFCALHILATWADAISDATRDSQKHCILDRNVVELWSTVHICRSLTQECQKAVSWQCGRTSPMPDTHTGEGINALVSSLLRDFSDIFDRSSGWPGRFPPR